MRTMLGAIVGALAVGAVLVSYDLGERRAFSRDMAPVTQMMMGPDGVARPYLVQAGQTSYGQTPYAGSPYAFSPYATTAPAVMAPYGGYAVPAQYVNERVVTPQPVVRRAAAQRPYTTERAAAPSRSWKKSALLIGGSAGAGAGVGALIGGKKGAGIGALIGGGSAAIYDQVKRH
jgi:hypothetical protein